MAALRILHCPENVAGNPASLARAEREAGLESLAVGRRTRFGFPLDAELFEPTDPERVRQLKRLRLIRRALREFDIVHYNFGSTILPDGHVPPVRGLAPLRRAYRGAMAAYLRLGGSAELRLLRAAGKGIAVTYQGDDARQGDYSRAHFAVNAATEVEPGYYTARTDRIKRRKIRRFDRFAHRIYAVNPDLLRVLPPRAEFLPYAHVDPRAWTALPPDVGSDRPLTIVHAPTHQGVKGSRFIMEAAERLRGEGIARIEFVLVENLPHEEAAAIYRRADLVVDQVLLGWYGGFAVEAMALGKPVVAYIRPEDLRYLPAGMRDDLPVVSAHPGTLFDTLRSLVTERRPELPELGRRGRQYVERWHDPRRIARRLKADYEAMGARSASSGREAG